MNLSPGELCIFIVYTDTGSPDSWSRYGSANVVATFSGDSIEQQAQDVAEKLRDALFVQGDSPTPLKVASITVYGLTTTVTPS